MIALTQEKRNSEIDKIKSKIEAIKGDMDIGWTAEEYLLIPLQIALAALTAEPAYHVFKHPDGKLFHALVDESCKGHNDVYPVYTSPPVPEIKLPHELKNLINAVEFYHAVEAENPDIETGMWNDAYDWIKKAAIEAAPAIKRLNGLGE